MLWLAFVAMATITTPAPTATRAAPAVTRTATTTTTAATETSAVHGNPSATSRTAVPAATAGGADAQENRTATLLELQVGLLKQQLETERFYSEQLRNGVYFAGGVLLTLTAGLLAYGWYTNRVTYDRDLRALSAELAATAGKADTALRQMIDERFASASEDMTARYETLRKEIEATGQRTLKEYLADLWFETRSLRFDMLDREVKSELAAGIHRSGVDFSTQMLELALKLESRFHLEQAVEIILATLASIAKNQTTVWGSDISRLEVVVNQLPANGYSAIREKIFAAIRQVTASA